jgi:hypothetical protein
MKQVSLQIIPILQERNTYENIITKVPDIISIYI